MLAPTHGGMRLHNQSMTQTAPAHAVIASPSLPLSNQVLLLVDFINPMNFPGGEDLAPRALEAARATAALKERLTAEGVATIYANDNYGIWQSDFHSLVSKCLGMEGPPGEIARLLYPQAEDLTILKPRHSAFYASPLELLLREMETRQLVICGLATDMCVQLTAGDAFLREFECWVPADCTAAESDDAKALSIEFMQKVLKCDIRESAEGSSKAKRPRKRA
jgi:nicotinamidase-related amidase